MNESHSDAPDADGDTVSTVEWARRRFLAACDESLEDQPPPDVDAYLSRVPEPDRSRLRLELESAGQDRRRRRRGPDDTALLPAPHATPDATLDYPPRVAAEATRGGGADATGDEPAVADPQATVAPEAGKLAGSHAPDAIAGYEVLGVLGRGAMGVVYKARQVGLNRVVALKMILSGDHAGERRARPLPLGG